MTGTTNVGPGARHLRQLLRALCARPCGRRQRRWRLLLDELQRRG